MVNVQGRALTIKNINFEWVSPMPAPYAWGWAAPPTAPELGLPLGSRGEQPADRRDHSANTADCEVLCPRR